MYFVKDKNGINKVAGTSTALVIDNRDPDKRGRIRVNSPFAGETEWIEYLRTPESFNVPQVGDVVYLESPSGDADYYRAWGNQIKGPDVSPELREEFRREVPTNRGFYTPGGHLIEFDDGIANPGQDPANSEQTTEKRGVRITTSQGTKFHLIDDDDNGERRIVLEDPDGNYIIIDRENGSMDTNIDGNYNVVVGEDAKHIVVGDTLIDTGGDLNTKSGGDTNMDADGNFNIVTSGDAKIVAAGSTTIDTPATTVTGTLDVDGDVTAKANLNVTGNSQLGGGTPMVLATAQFIGTGNLGAPVISSIMTGLSTKVTGS